MTYQFVKNRRFRPPTWTTGFDVYRYRHEDWDREIGVVFHDPDGDFLVLRYGERMLTFVSLEDYDAEMAEIRQAVADAIERRMAGC